MKAVSTILISATTVSGFAVLPQHTVTSSSTSLNGLFDGVKDAFAAPPLERSTIDSERETPIDRWMGWSVVAGNEQKAVPAQSPDFIDSMDEGNYMTVALKKPMGIVFEENDAQYGGIFVQSLKEDGIAAANGNLQAGDQLVSVGTKKVSGLIFDDALGAIIDSEDDETNLTFFRGNAKQFYGPTGPSSEWLDKLCEKGGVAVSKAA